MKNFEARLTAKQSGRYEVVVVGGGPAGSAAAIAASRMGAKTLLIEATGCLGGVGTSGMVTVLLGGMKRTNPREWAVGGIFKELVQQLVKDGAACEPGAPLGALALFGDHIFFEPEALKALLEQKAADAGVEVLYFSTFVAPDVENGRIKGVYFANKEGLNYAAADFVVDCSGDADVAFRAGFPTVKGRSDTGLMTASTLLSHVEDVDADALEAYFAQGHDRRFKALVRELKEKGVWTYDEETIIVVPTLRRGVYLINTNRQVGVDGTDAASLTRAMMAGRRNAREFLEKILRPYYPGFANARLRETAPVVGIRETRKIVGEHTLTDSDCSEGSAFPDTIALSGYCFDLPDPKRPSMQPHFSFFWGKDLPMKKPFVEVPYRCLVPVGSENLLVAGRCVSVKDMALGPVRIMPTCYAMGEAAGVAAALCAKESLRPKDAPVDRLLQILRDNGAVVG